MHRHDTSSRVHRCGASSSFIVLVLVSVVLLSLARARPARGFQLFPRRDADETPTLTETTPTLDTRGDVATLVRSLVQSLDACAPRVECDRAPSASEKTPTSTLAELAADVLASAATDIAETNEAMTFTTDVPGMDLSHIDVFVDVARHALTIQGERREDVTDETVRKRERRFGTFRGVFALPASAVVDDITASYDKGVLKVVVPKGNIENAPRRVKRIAVASAT
jgi:HSP20 family molecular chaperone IbpA